VSCFSRCYGDIEENAHNLVIVNYTVGISKVVVHEAQVWIVIGVREEGIALQGLDAAVVASPGKTPRRCVGCCMAIPFAIPDGVIQTACTGDTSTAALSQAYR
jgi:hypothetical protein